MTLADFLLARYAELEEVARKVIEGTVNPEWLDTEEEPWWCDEQTEHVAMAPARVLADVEAKRRIVELHPRDDAGYCGDDIGLVGCKWLWPCPTLRALALPYADHEDYREAWRP